LVSGIYIVLGTAISSTLLFTLKHQLNSEAIFSCFLCLRS